MIGENEQSDDARITISARISRRFGDTLTRSSRNFLIMRNQYYVQYEYMYHSSLNYRSYYVAQILDCCKARCLTV